MGQIETGKMAQSSDLTEAYTGSPRPTPNKEDVELKKPDSTWLIPYKGKQWPVVICHYEQTPRAFQEIHPPRDTHVPAILLGRHILSVPNPVMRRKFADSFKYFCR